LPRPLGRGKKENKTIGFSQNKHSFLAKAKRLVFNLSHDLKVVARQNFLQRNVSR